MGGTDRVRVTARVRGRAARLGLGLGLKSTSKPNQPIISAGDLRFFARKWKKNKSGKHQHSTKTPNTVCTPKEVFNTMIKSILLGSSSNFKQILCFYGIYRNIVFKNAIG